MVAAVAAAAVLACHPHPGLGTVTVTRGAHQVAVELATCAEQTMRAPAALPAGSIVSPDGRSLASVVAVHPKGSATGSTAIVVRARATGASHVVYRLRESFSTVPAGEPGPLELVGWSPRGDWLLFALDPMGSASLAADGVRLQAVPVAGGAPRPVTDLLLYPDYLAWCGNRLVVTAGGDRIATNDKRLIVTGPPAWRARPLVSAPSLAWGSLTCAPDGRSVVVQSQRRSGTNETFVATRWALWRVGLDGTRTQLTRPPKGSADESPRFSHDGGTVLFVRARDGAGQLYALRGGRTVGPLLALGSQLGYYGHEDWWATMRWSLG